MCRKADATITCYNALMSFWRKAGLFIAGALLPLLLFVWGLVFSVYNVLGTPDNIKHAIETSGIYQSFARDALQQQQNKQEGQSTEEIPLNQPEVQQIVSNAASPEILQREVEKFLDGAYAWISGESQRLNLEINLTDIKTKLTDGLTQHATNRLNTLPTCDMSVQMVNPEFDVFSATCVPKGLDKNTAINNVRTEVDKAFKDPVITQEDIKNDNGKTLEEQLQAIQTSYQNIALGLWIGIFLILLCTAGVVWLSQTWRAGLKRAGWVFTGIGALSAGLAILAAYVLGKIVEQLGTDNAQASAIAVLKTLAGDLRNWWMGFGIVVLLLGIAALVAPRFIKTDEPTHKESGKGEETLSEKQTTVAHQPTPTSNSKPKHRI